MQRNGIITSIPREMHGILIILFSILSGGDFYEKEKREG